jgi:hypothetical protein
MTDPVVSGTGGTPESARTQIGAIGPADPSGAIPAIGDVLIWDGSAWVPGTIGGGGGPGIANAIVYVNSTGTAEIADAKFVAAPTSLGRPQFWDWRSVLGVGPVFRQGAWQADGDLSSQTAEGFISYGPNALGVGPSLTDGGLARVKSNQLGLAQIINGVLGNALFYYFGFDPTGFVARDDAGATIAEIIRQGPSTGVAWFQSLALGSAGGPKISSGAGTPEGAVTGSPGDVYLNTTGGASTTFYVKTSGVATNTGWSTFVVIDGPTGQVFIGSPTSLNGSDAGIQYSSLVADRGQIQVYQYGAHTGIPGISSFKSRDTTIGGLAAIIANDVFFRATAEAVACDNITIDESATISIIAEGTPGATEIPSRFELELTNLSGTRQLALRVSSEGSASVLGSLGVGGVSGPKWSSGVGSPEGIVTGSVGDLFTRTDGGAGTTLYVKESGIATMTGWIGK